MASAISSGADQAGADALGPQFAEALGRKEFDRVKSLLDEDIDFRALTPRRAWEASNSADVVGDILTYWFDDGDHLEEIVSVQNDAFSDRQRVAYRFRGHNADGPFIIEQQAYYTQQDGRINWMRVLCSGFRPD